MFLRTLVSHWEREFPQAERYLGFVKATKNGERKRYTYAQRDLQTCLTVKESEVHIVEAPVVQNIGYSFNESATLAAHNVLAVDFDHVTLEQGKAIHAAYAAVGLLPSMWVWTSLREGKYGVHLWFLLDTPFPAHTAPKHRRCIASIGAMAHPPDQGVLEKLTWFPRLPGSARKIRPSGIIPYLDTNLSTLVPVRDWERTLKSVPVVFRSPNPKSANVEGLHHQVEDLLDHIGIEHQTIGEKVHMGHCPACESEEISIASRNCSVVSGLSFICKRSTCPSNSDKSKANLRLYAKDFVFEASQLAPYKVNDLGAYWDANTFMPVSVSRAKAEKAFLEWETQGGKLVLAAGTGTGKTHNAIMLLIRQAAACMELDEEVESLLTDTPYPPEDAPLYLVNRFRAHLREDKDATWATWAPSRIASLMASEQKLRGVVILSRSYAEVKRIYNEVMEKAPPEMHDYLRKHLSARGTPTKLWEVDDEVICRIAVRKPSTAEEARLKRRLETEVAAGYSTNKSMCMECPHKATCQAQTRETVTVPKTSAAHGRLLLGVRQNASSVLKDTYKPYVIVDEEVKPIEVGAFPLSVVKQAAQELRDLSPTVLTDPARRTKLEEMAQWCVDVSSTAEQVWDALAPGDYGYATQLALPQLGEHAYKAFATIENYRDSSGAEERVRWPAAMRNVAKHVSVAPPEKQAVGNGKDRYGSGGLQLQYLDDVASIFKPHDVCFLDASASTPGWARPRYKGFLDEGETLKHFSSFCEDKMLRMYWESYEATRAGLRKHLDRRNPQILVKESIKVFLQSIIRESAFQRHTAEVHQYGELNILVTTYKEMVPELKHLIERQDLITISNSLFTGDPTSLAKLKVNIKVCYHEEVIGQNIYSGFDAVAMVGSPTVMSLSDEWVWAEELSGSQRLANQAEEAMIVQVEGRLRGASRERGQPRGVVGLFGRRMPAFWHQIAQTRELSYEMHTRPGVLQEHKGGVAWLSYSDPTKQKRPDKTALVKEVHAHLQVTSLCVWRLYAWLWANESTEKAEHVQTLRRAVLQRHYQDMDLPCNALIRQPTSEAGALYNMLELWRGRLHKYPMANTLYEWANPRTEKRGAGYEDRRERVENTLENAGFRCGYWEDRFHQYIMPHERENYEDAEKRFFFTVPEGYTYEQAEFEARLLHERYVWACRWLLNALELVPGSAKAGWKDVTESIHPGGSGSFLTGVAYRHVNKYVRDIRKRRGEIVKAIHNWLQGAPTESLITWLSVPVHHPEQMDLSSGRMPVSKSYMVKSLQGLSIEVKELPQAKQPVPVFCSLGEPKVRGLDAPRYTPPPYTFVRPLPGRGYPPLPTHPLKSFGRGV